MGEVLRPALGKLVHGIDGGDGVPRPELSVELEAGPRVVDGPGVDDLGERAVRPGREIELLLALEEEGPLLVVKQGVALVEIDLSRVGFDLAEVRVEGAVEDELGGQAVLPRQAEVAPPPSGLEGPLLEGARPAVGHGGQKLQERVMRDAFEEQGPRLGQEVRALRGVEGRERAVLREAADPPLEDDPHLDGLAAPVAEALEREADLDGVAGVIYPPFAIPNDVHRVVFLVALETGVPLDAERIDVEGVEALVVVERIQVDAGPVVGVDGVPAADRGLDLRRLRVRTAEGEIEIFAVVGIIDDGPGRHILAVVRVPRLEVRFPGGLLPDRVVEVAVDLRRDLGMHGPKRQEIGRGLGGDRGRGGGEGHKQRED